jgi:hypothetical protein
LVKSESRREARAFWRPVNIWLIATRNSALWQGLVAVAPVLIFVEVRDFVSWFLLYIVGIAAAGALNNSSLRVEAEIEADWTALCQMAYFQHNTAGSPILKQKKLNPLTSNIVPMRDSNLTLADQMRREQVFNEMRPFFAASLIDWRRWPFLELEDLMWQATHRYEAVRLAISFVIIVAGGFIAEFHRFAASTISIPLAFNLILVLGGFIACTLARARYFAQVERAIAENGVDKKSGRWAEL